MHSPISLPSVCVVHPWDPWRQTLGGFDTFLDGFLRCAPAEWQLELIGLTTDPRSRPPGRWLELEFEGRPVRFLAVLSDPEPEVVRRVPLSLRFGLSLAARRVRSSAPILQFHRFEAGLSFRVRKGQRSVYVLHNHPMEVRSAHADVRWRRWPAVHDLILRRQLASASAIYAVDPRTPAWIREQLPTMGDRTHHLHSWADRQIFHPVPPAVRSAHRRRLRQRFQWPDDARVLIYAGRFELQKDPLLLIEAFARLAALRPEVRLLMVGQGRLSNDIDAAALRLGVRSRVVRTLPVQRRQLADDYRGADLAVGASGYESGPRHLLEALTCGLPVVTFDVGQVGVLLQRHPALGVLVETRSAAALAEGLDQGLRLPAESDSGGSWMESLSAYTPQAALEPVFRLYSQWLSAPQVGREVRLARADAGDPGPSGLERGG